MAGNISCNDNMIAELKKKYRELYGEDKANNREELDKLYDMMFSRLCDMYKFQGFLEGESCKEICIGKKGIYGRFGGFSGIDVNMYLDDIDEASMSNQLLIQDSYETEETEMVERLLGEIPLESVIFDVGANLGWYGINMCKMCSGAEVFFFEPVPNTVNRLKMNLEINDLDVNKVLQYGLYDTNKVSKFYYDVIESAASSMSDLRERETTQVIEIQLRKMDDIVQELGIKRLDFIKIDVEGAELFALRGGERVIREYQPIIFSEMLRKWAKKQGYHPNDIINFMNGLGYDCFVIFDKSLRKIKEVTEETLETNYFFLHREKHSKIIGEFTTI